MSETKLLAGRKSLIIGTANERSMGWAIAKKLHEQGAELAFNYQNEALERRVRPLAESVHAALIERCDVSDDNQMSALFEKIKQTWGALDILIHSVAHAKREELEGRFIQTSRDGFNLAMDVSVYSLIALARHAEPLMEGREGSILTLSYEGGQRVVPNYNVMGVAKAALESAVRYLAYDLGTKKIRVNAISAGPVKTLAAAGIRNFRDMLASAAEKTPLRENITAEDVGALSAFLCSPAARHITGTIHFVDSGAHIMGA